MPSSKAILLWSKSIVYYFFVQGPSKKTKQPCPTVSLDEFLKNHLRRNSTAHLLSYQRLPDASPQHYPTHSLKVHRNMKPSHWGGRARERVRYSSGKEEGKEDVAGEHSGGKVDHHAEEGRLEQREVGKKWICSVKDQALFFPPPCLRG